MSHDDTNKGAIWRNDKKETERQPDFKGQANIDGVEYWVSAWKRGPNDNPKSPALRFAFTAKEQKPSAPQPQSGGVDFEDDIPF